MRSTSSPLPTGLTTLLGASLLAAAALTLAGCTTEPGSVVHDGQSADDVAKLAGPPTARYAMPAGATRLEYSTGPFGKRTWMIDLDASGRVTAVTQVMTEANFNALRNGTSREDVLRMLGHPAEVHYVGWRESLETWSYRYETPFCQWFQLSFDPQGRAVHDTAYGPDPLCDVELRERDR